ncbi:hypothetical protein CASFOL_025708 [Castilleja foliolosa]|uniref:RNI-like superfamily protein n=1 Tax=Castilleja foliolosa TaxID=1961234 RepID=A0ABD3CU80_9LAMI
MENGKAENVTTALRSLQLDNNIVKPKSTGNSLGSTVDFFTWNKGKAAPSLVSLCMGVVGSNLEDITDELADIALTFPFDIKMVLLAIARRRKLLSDDILIALADSSFEILDISGSDVSDSGLCRVVDICQNLRAVDISQCRSLTSTGVIKLLQQCHSLQILRWGPDLNNVEGESWEELDTVDLTHGAQSLHWLVWQNIDKDSEETLATECPRIVVNPKPSLWGFRGTEVPREALSQFALDDPIVKDIDPQTWAVSGFNASRTHSLLKPQVANPNELSVAEKFRLAFLERDTRLAPKRAKNARQRERRAKREWVMTDTKAKALALASKATSSVNLRDF